jgi:hypothetical protein
VLDTYSLQATWGGRGGGRRAGKGLVGGEGVLGGYAG